MRYERENIDTNDSEITGTSQEIKTRAISNCDSEHRLSP